MRVALKGVNGVDGVEVSLNKGLADVTLKPGNSVNMNQLRHAIAKNGFTTKQSVVTVNGVLLLDNGKPKLRVSGTNEMYELTSEPGQAKGIDVSNMAGKNVTVEGVIPEAARGKTPETILFRNIHE